MSKERVLRVFLDSGADPNIVDRSGLNCLHITAQQHENETSVAYARMLINYKANINGQCNYGNTPLHCAIENNFVGLIQILLENDADVSVANKIGDTPMSLAIKSSQLTPSTLEAIGEKFIIQQYCKLNTDSKHLEQVCQIGGLHSFKAKCDEEILRLKNENIGDSKITMYDILVSPTHRIGKFFLNYDILCTLKGCDWRRYLFGEALNRNFQKGMKRLEAIKSGFQVCEIAFPTLPYVILDQLIDYLSNEDLKNLECYIRDEISDK